MKRPFVLINEQARARAIQCVRDAPLGYCVVVGEPTRNLEQNAKMHAVFGDIAKQATYLGRALVLPQWKTLLISGHSIATGRGVDMVPGIEGEFVNIRESSASMSVSRMSSVIEYSIAYGVQNGVNFEQNGEPHASK